jgi:hypothetical protein
MAVEGVRQPATCEALAGPDASVVERWAEAERADLARLAAELHAALVEAAIAEGSFASDGDGAGPLPSSLRMVDGMLQSAVAELDAELARVATDAGLRDVPTLRRPRSALALWQDITGPPAPVGEIDGIDDIDADDEPILAFVATPADSGDAERAFWGEESPTPRRKARRWSPRRSW